MDPKQELDQTLFNFEDIQAELNYKRAQDTLRELVARLDLTVKERKGLEPELQGLQSMLYKLEDTVVHIAVFGMVGRGKSSLLNALIGQDVFTTGPTHGVTQVVQQSNWLVDHQGISPGLEPTIVRLTLCGQGQSKVQLIDTPGIDEVQGEEREALAHQVAKQADLILFIIAGDITKVEYEALRRLRLASKPMLLVFNKIDQFPDADRLAIYHKIRDERLRELISPDEIVMAAASPLVARAVQQEDGRVVAQVGRGTPRVEELKLKILEILDREGKSLVALNTMLYADEVQEQVVQRKLMIRDRSANQVIWNGVITKAVAIALNPLTVADILSGAAIDVALILTLSRLYGMPMTQTAAIGLLQKMAISMGGVTASEFLANLGLSSLKTLLGMSTIATGGLSIGTYVSVALTQGGVAGISTHVIGQTTKVFLANGATWGPEGPKAVINRILDSLDETSILSRIRVELLQKIGHPLLRNHES
ncbi:MAG: GTP-binding protein [Cyanobacteria bacterium LVE1205-1]|jgi:small GTP-binding protein